MMLIPNGVVAAPLASSRCELEANRSISSMDALLGTRCLDIRPRARSKAKPSSRQGDGVQARDDSAPYNCFTGCT